MQWITLCDSDYEWFKIRCILFLYHACTNIIALLIDDMCVACPEFKAPRYRVDWNCNSTKYAYIAIVAKSSRWSVLPSVISPTWIRKVSHAAATVNATARGQTDGIHVTRGKRLDYSPVGSTFRTRARNLLFSTHTPTHPHTYPYIQNAIQNLSQASSSLYAWRLYRYRSTSCWMKRCACSATSTWTNSYCIRWSGTRTATNFIATRPETRPRC